MHSPARAAETQAASEISCTDSPASNSTPDGVPSAAHWRKSYAAAGWFRRRLPHCRNPGSRNQQRHPHDRPVNSLRP
jgi:hypothetical protein